MKLLAALPLLVSCATVQPVSSAPTTPKAQWTDGIDINNLLLKDQKLKDLVLPCFIDDSCEKEKESAAPASTPPASPKRVDVIEVNLAGFIDVDAASMGPAVAAVEEGVKGGAFAIFVEINSPGGYVEEGFKLVRAIEKSKLPSYCVVDGQADSEAFYILQACTKRYMTRRSMLMIHEPATHIFAATVLRRKILEGYISDHELLVNRWVEFAGRRMNMKIEAVKEKIRYDDWYMAYDEARTVGAIDGSVESVEKALETLQTERKL